MSGMPFLWCHRPRRVLLWCLCWYWSKVVSATCTPTFFGIRRDRINFSPLLALARVSFTWPLADSYFPCYQCRQYCIFIRHLFVCILWCRIFCNELSIRCYILSGVIQFPLQRVSKWKCALPTLTVRSCIIALHYINKHIFCNYFMYLLVLKRWYSRMSYDFLWIYLFTQIFYVQ